MCVARALDLPVHCVSSTNYATSGARCDSAAAAAAAGCCWLLRVLSLFASVPLWKFENNGCSRGSCRFPCVLTTTTACNIRRCIDVDWFSSQNQREKRKTYAPPAPSAPSARREWKVFSSLAGHRTVSVRGRTYWYIHISSTACECEGMVVRGTIWHKISEFF